MNPQNRRVVQGILVFQNKYVLATPNVNSQEATPSVHFSPSVTSTGRANGERSEIDRSLSSTL